MPFQDVLTPSRKDRPPMRTKQQRTFSEADKIAWRAAKQQRLTDLGEQLKTQVAAVQDSDAFKRYLAAQAVFHRYSARNVFLILFQRPEVTRVAGYTGWQKLGRQVRRGETGITIFAPAPFKQIITDTATGEVTEERIPRFKTTSVFDMLSRDFMAIAMGWPFTLRIYSKDAHPACAEPISSEGHAHGTLHRDTWRGRLSRLSCLRTGWYAPGRHYRLSCASDPLERLRLYPPRLRHGLGPLLHLAP